MPSFRAFGKRDLRWPRSLATPDGLLIDILQARAAQTVERAAEVLDRFLITPR
jgi:hypothetical protein